jgi:hypothetical protein
MLSYLPAYFRTRSRPSRHVGLRAFIYARQISSTLLHPAGSGGSGLTHAPPLCVDVPEARHLAPLFRPRSALPQARHLVPSQLSLCEYAFFTKRTLVDQDSWYFARISRAAKAYLINSRALGFDRNLQLKPKRA